MTLLQETTATFLIAAGLIGASAFILAAVPIAQLSRWALALHSLLFQQAEPKAAFALSAEGPRGQQWSLFSRALAWLLV